MSPQASANADSIATQPDFQTMVQRLQQYWADQGCLVWQPHNVEVGAGTMNPATFLNVLGPEPWNVVYVEPSVRPDDARYGENPNRVGRHHQMQVILKPDPGDPQQLYLDSLRAIGIDVTRHDIRFVEDNWESPALGAWGLGWEVWLDGLEITQFTYFQQAGSLDLEPVSVEITYGLDRILMALQDVDHFKNLAWNEHVRFGDLLLDYEVQTSRYYFELATVESLNAMYDLYEDEARHALAAGLSRVAHDYVLKCSHLFNVLDARGTVGVTERARFFGRMRGLARDVARLYLEERETAEYPLLDEDRPWVAGRHAAPTDHAPPQESGASGVSTAVGASALGEPPTTPADFVLELGTEELPPEDATAAATALAERASATLQELRLEHEGVTAHATPRRLVVRVSALAPRQSDVEEEVVGPPKRAAYDSEGRPTKAAEGFARKMGVAVEDLYEVERGGDARVATVRRESGRPAGEVLTAALSAWPRNLPLGRTMRWNASREGFSRPVRWLLALHGESIVPFEYAELTAGRETRGLRPLGSRRHAVAAAGDYPKLLRSMGVTLDAAARRDDIWRQVTATAASVDGAPGDDPGLLAEVTQLVEQPFAILGAFDAAYLDLPDALLVTVMRKHQRYFPVRSAQGELMPHFVAVANGASVDADLVRHGNEAVLRARFADAAYFWKQDCEQDLADFTAGLAGLTFQADLGSMLDKVGRLTQLVEKLADRMGASDDDRSAARRAAELAKSDLTTAMVVDFTSLQGVMGREYALRSGESEAVATAIQEQYRPSGAGDHLPATTPGTLLALADRLDSLVGLFAAGLRPSGTQDPYALRRAALGVSRILAEGDLTLDLREAVADTAALQPVEVTPEHQAEVLAFLRTRLEGQLREAGHAADAVAAVLAARGHDPAAALTAITILEQQVSRPDWTAMLTAYARCARLVRDRDDVPSTVAEAALEEGPEQALHEAVAAAWHTVDRDDPASVLAALVDLAPTIDGFFDGVMVMVDDEALRANRLAIVGRIAELPAQVADLSQMEGF
jgi:glycyl-tRNA synthetase